MFPLNKNKSRLHAVKTQAVLGYGLQIIVLIRGLLLIPFYVSIIGDRLYGLWLASGGVLVWLSMLDVGLTTGLLQRLSHNYGKKNFQLHTDYLINGLIIYSFFGVILLCSGYTISIYFYLIIRINQRICMSCLEL